MNGSLTPAEVERRRVAAMQVAPTAQDQRGGEIPARLGIDPDSDPVDVWITTENGLQRWRPMVDRFVVTRLPNGGRMLESGLGRLRLDAEQARHLARLLSAEPG